MAINLIAVSLADTEAADKMLPAQCLNASMVGDVRLLYSVCRCV